MDLRRQADSLAKQLELTSEALERKDEEIEELRCAVLRLAHSRTSGLLIWIASVPACPVLMQQRDGRHWSYLSVALPNMHGTVFAPPHLMQARVKICC